MDKFWEGEGEGDVLEEFFTLNKFKAGLFFFIEEPLANYPWYVRGM